MSQRDSKKMKRYRSVGTGYNSDDEYHRPRISAINEEGLKFISVEKLSEILKGKKGLEIIKMPEDGNCLFHSVADQIYGDNTFHDVVRKLCLDYMEKERNHFSQFVTEDFSEYINRKRQDGVFGNHLELQAISEIYSRPVQIYAIDEEPLNIFQGSYTIDNPPILLSYHWGNHYNSVHDPLHPTIGIGLGLPGLKGGEGMTKEMLKKTLLQSEQQMIDRLIMERTKQESEEMELENDIMRQTAKETEQIEIENEYLKQVQMESEKEFMNQIMQKSRAESDPELSTILEQTKREQAMKEEMEFNKILEMSRNEYYGGNNGRGGDDAYMDQFQSALEKTILEQSLYEYYGLRK